MERRGFLRTCLAACAAVLMPWRSRRTSVQLYAWMEGQSRLLAQAEVDADGWAKLDNPVQLQAGEEYLIGYDGGVTCSALFWEKNPPALHVKVDKA